MKKTLLLLVAIVTMMMTTGCKIQLVKESEAKDIETRHIAATSVKSVNLSAPLTVIYTEGDTVKVDIKGTKLVLDDYYVKVKDGEVTVTSKSVNRSYIKSMGQVVVFGEEHGKKIILTSSENSDVLEAPVVYITAPSLSRVAIKGSGDFVADKLTARNFDMSVTGSGDITIKSLQCNDLTTTITGSGDITVSELTGRNAGATVDGSGDVIFKKAKLQNVDFKVMGSGDIVADFLSAANVKASIMGSGDIELSGNADHLDQNVRGSGEIDADGLRTKH